MSIYDETVLADAPLSFWKLDESSGSFVDSGSGGSAGTVNGTVTRQVVGSSPGSRSAISMAGAGYVDVGLLGSFGSALAAGFSIEFWAKYSSTAAQGAILGQLNTGATTGLMIALNTDVNTLGLSAGKTTFWLRNTAGSTFGGMISALPNDGAWHHVVWTCNPGTPAMTVYVDGVSAAVTVITGGVALSGTANFGFDLFLGSRNNRAVQDLPLSGSLDNVALYTSVLSAARVAAHLAASGVPYNQVPNWPALHTEIAVNADPNSATAPIWSDVSSRNLGFTITRGRQYELAQSDVGTAGITLDNRDGAFDPSNTSSPYSPNLKIYRAMRVRANYAGTTYSLMTGYVERWPQSWSSDGFGTNGATMVDGLAILGARTFDSLLQETVLADNPLAYWPLQDAAGSSVVAEIAGRVTGADLAQRDAKAGAAARFALGSATTTSLVDGDTSLAITPGAAAFSASVFQAQNGSPLLTSGVGGVANATLFSLEAWVNPVAAPGAHSAGQIVAQNIGDGNTGGSAGFLQGIGLRVTSADDLSGDGLNLTTGSLCGYYYGSGQASLISNSSSYVNTGWNHVVFTALMSGTNGVFTNLYINGSLAASDGLGGYPDFRQMTIMTPVQIGGVIFDAPVTSGFQLNGNVCHVALYDKVLTLAQAAKHYAVGKTLFEGDGPGARIGHILDLVPWRLSATTTDHDDSTFRAAKDYATNQALDLVHSVASDASGVFYVDATGAAIWQSRNTRFLSTSSAFVFGDGVGELPFTEIEFDYDPTYVYNDVQITRNDGTVSVDLNTASIASYFDRPYTATVDLDAQTQADELASWIGNTHAQPAMRPSVIEVDPSSNPALWPAALGVDIGTRVTVRRRAFGSPNVISIDCFVEGVTHTVDTSAWKTQFTLSPVLAQPLIWDDATVGKWDVDVWGY